MFVLKKKKSGFFVCCCCYCFGVLKSPEEKDRIILDHQSVVMVQVQAGDNIREGWLGTELLKG